MCDTDYTVTFTKHAVTINSPTETPITTGWTEYDDPRLWHMYLLTNPEDLTLLSSALDVQETSLQAFRAYELPSAEALVRYFHAYAGFPVCGTWLKAIKADNFKFWMGITYQNVAKSYPI